MKTSWLLGIGAAAVGIFLLSRQSFGLTSSQPVDRPGGTALPLPKFSFELTRPAGTEGDRWQDFLDKIGRPVTYGSDVPGYIPEPPITPYPGTYYPAKFVRG